MKHLRRNLWLSVSAVAMVLITLILLSAFTVWMTSAEIRKRHNEYPAQIDDFPDNAQVLVLQMNSLLLILEIHPELRDSIRPQFYQLAQNLADEFANQEYASQEAIIKIREGFDAYLQAAKAFLEAPLGKLVLEERLEGLQLVYQKAERPVLELEKLSLAREEKLATILGDYGFAHERLVWLVFVLASLASILVAASAVIYLLNRVSRLRLEMSQLKVAREKQDKLASLGILASGVAHEIRNPLTAIKARLFALERKLPPVSEASDQTREISKEINRLEKIVKEVLLFARPPRPVTIDFEAGPLLEEVGNLLRGELELRALHLKISPVAGLIARGDPEQIKQILINLVQNAADASKSGDTILLTTRKNHDHLAKSNSPQIAIEVIDQGPGISKEESQKVFNPFYTTKSKGTGLGLSISRRLAHMQNGDLLFFPREGQGTTFTLVLPSAQ